MPVYILPAVIIVLLIINIFVGYQAMQNKAADVSYKLDALAKSFAA